MFEDDLNPQATGYHEMPGRGSEVRDLSRGCRLILAIWILRAYTRHIGLIEI